VRQQPHARPHGSAGSGSPGAGLWSEVLGTSTYRLIGIERPSDLERFTPSPGISPLTPDEFARHRPDAHWVLADEDGRLAARCSLWWTSTPPCRGHRLGFIGHCAAGDAAAAQTLLAQARAALTASGCTLAVAPIDGSTWRPYRFITDRGTEPLFLFEPDHPDDWPSHLIEQTFTPWARYHSAVTTALTRHDARLQAIADRMAREGVSIRPLNLTHIDEELRRIYAVTVASFRRSFLFDPIDQAEFLEEYRPILRFVEPAIVLIAEQRERPVGFVFAVPDWLQRQRGGRIDTIIVKTLAAVPGRSYAGLGSLLASRCEHRAAGLGYTRAIHALMHEASTSRNISHRYAKTIRRYTLFARTLP
jgi:GNAT superfamily N-acetyltransferase